MFKKILYIIIFAAFNSIAISAESLTNVSALAELSNSAATVIGRALQASGADTVFLDISSNPADFLVEKSLLELSNNVKFMKILPANPSENTHKVLTIRTEEFSINYIDTGNDSLTRQATLSLSAFVVAEGGTIDLIDLPRLTKSEKISREDAERINKQSPDFAKGEIPKTDISFFEKIAAPVIVATAAVLTVVLFFSIRSK